MKKSPSKALFWIRSSDSVMCENQIVLIIVLITLLKKKNRWLSLKVFHIRIF